MNPARNAERLILGLAIALVASFLVALAVGVHPFAETPAGISASTRLCARLLTVGGNAGLFTTTLIMGLLALQVMAAVIAVGRGLRKLGRLRLALSALPEVRPTTGLRRTLDQVGLTNRVVVVDSPDPFAFTMGVLNTRIYLSTETVRRLTMDELEAVLWHEKRHVERRDPLKLQALGAIRGAFGYVPALHNLSQLFLRSREYDADDMALRHTGNPRALLGALSKLALPGDSNLAAAAIGYGGFAADRIARLLPLAERRPIEGSTNVLALGIGTLAVLAALPLISLLLTEAPHLISICLS